MRRALHYVMKIGNRAEAAKFFREVIQMKFLRHEEFEEGCKAACNGPYDGRWSKSMVGYGPEDSHFVLELTYSYGIGGYELGNAFQGITIVSSDVLRNVESTSWPRESTGEPSTCTLSAPGGYKFCIVDGQHGGNGDDPVSKVTLSISCLQRSYDYWVCLLGMTCYTRDESRLLLGYAPEQQCMLELVLIGEPVRHGTATGRLAFSCPYEQLKSLQDLMITNRATVVKPLVSLDTPGKATVDVVILADPDGHEICFVGDEGFRELSRPDPQADGLLDEAVRKDGSDAWYAKSGRQKTASGPVGSDPK